MQDHNIGKERNKGSKGSGKNSRKGKRNEAPKGGTRPQQDEGWFSDWQPCEEQGGSQVGRNFNVDWNLNKSWTFRPSRDNRDTRSSKDRQKGGAPQRGFGKKRGKDMDYSSRLEDSEVLVPCAECMCLLGTNSRCDNCFAPLGQTHLTRLQETNLYSSLVPFDQSRIPGYPCPLLLSDGNPCKAKIFGTGDCVGCRCWQEWSDRYYGPHFNELPNPALPALILGYEHALLQTLEDEPKEYVKQLQTILQHVYFYFRYPPCFVQWLDKIVHPAADDPLRQLPWPKGQTQFKMPSNVQSSSYLLEFVARAYEAIPPGFFDFFELPDPNLVESLALTYFQCITLDLLPWVQIVWQSYARAFELREVTPAWTVEALEEFGFVMLDDPDEDLLDQFMHFLVEPIESSALVGRFLEVTLLTPMRT